MELPGSGGLGAGVAEPTGPPTDGAAPAELAGGEAVPQLGLAAFCLAAASSASSSAICSRTCAIMEQGVRMCGCRTLLHQLTSLHQPPSVHSNPLLYQTMSWHRLQPRQARTSPLQAHPRAAVCQA